MDLSRDMLDEEIEEFISEETAQMLQGMIISLRERVRIEQQVFNSLRKLDALQDLIDNPEVSEIMVNGPQNIFYEKFGCVHKWEQSFSSEEKMQDIIQQIVGRHNRVVNLSNPIVDTRLNDGSRVNIVLSPISLDGSAITIRKFPEHPLDMDALIKKGAISKEAADLLKYLVQAKYSLLISGGTSSGKTTFLNALSQYIPEDERVITIEDSAELQIQGIHNLVRLETRNANMEGVMPVTIRDLIRSALRMRPEPSYRPSTQCDESTMAFRRRPETSRSRDSGQISVCITHSFAFSNRSFCIAPIRSAADAYREKERTERRPRSRSGSGRIRSIPSTS